MYIHPWFRKLRSTDTVADFDEAMRQLEEGAERMMLAAQRSRRNLYYLRRRRLERAVRDNQR